jgi:DNA-binding transcriptional LysR family regulator
MRRGAIVTLGQLRVLLAVADRGGFTAAAEHTGRTQLAISRVIGAIERELQTALFVRHRDGVVPTEAGLIAIRHARETISCVDRLSEEILAMAGQISGTLRIASLPSATGSLLAVPLRAFTDRHPQVAVRLFEGSDQEVRDWLSQGAADVGVVTLPAPGHECVTLGGDEMVAVLAAAHVLTRGRSVTLAALAREEFILPTGGCAPLILTAAHRAGVTLDVSYEARDPAAIVEMVATGLGVSVIPTLNLPRDADGVTTRPLQPRLPRTLALALGPKPKAGPVARAFLDELPKRTTGEQDPARPPRRPRK